MRKASVETLLGGASAEDGAGEQCRCSSRSSDCCRLPAAEFLGCGPGTAVSAAAADREGVRPAVASWPFDTLLTGACPPGIWGRRGSFHCDWLPAAGSCGRDETDWRPGIALPMATAGFLRAPVELSMPGVVRNLSRFRRDLPGRRCLAGSAFPAVCSHAGSRRSYGNANCPARTACPRTGSRSS